MLCCFLVIHLILPPSLAIGDLCSCYLLKTIHFYTKFLAYSQFCHDATPVSPNTHLCLWAAPLSEDTATHPRICSDLQVSSPKQFFLLQFLSNPHTGPANLPLKYLLGHYSHGNPARVC